MRKRTKEKVAFILFVTLVAAYINLPKKIPIAGQVIERQGPAFDLLLGLDLVGGSHLVFEADTSELSGSDKEDAISSLREVIARRVNLYGVSEPNIQTSSYEGKDRIIVELPGISNTQEAVDLVGKTAQLSFTRLQTDENREDDGGQAQEVLVPTELTGKHLKKASVTFDSATGNPAVSLEFNKEGSELFEKLTEANTGKAIPIVLDGQIVSAPVVQGKITGGQAQITGTFTVDEAKELVIQLNAGALPVPVKLIEQRTIGATLGAESIQKSIRAGLVGVGIVFIFMILLYGRLGLVADLGLIIFALVTFALYKLIPVVLTLPGIAGFLLSVGMAVDANILIFERFREEKRKGINTLFALETSFGRAWDSIRDANIATLATAFILANPLDWEVLHTSGPVRGFAMTLALGIGVSLFTGVFVARNLLRLIIRK